ncbi:MAG TPA: hypothetical protein VKU41_10120 [Polyangiaceae bacterium]|nr:hypothetical protein [Polyangiaceae bacterium]
MRRGVFGVGAVALGFATFGWSPSVHAAGFATQRFGGEQGGVLATNPTSVYYNPGAMGFTGNGALGVYGSAAFRNITWQHQATVAPGASPDSQIGNSGEAHAFNVFGGPAIGGLVRFGNLVIGGGFFAPFYGRVHWDKNNDLTAAQKAKYPLAADGVARWFDIDTELSILYFSAGAAYRLGPVSIGAVGNVIYSRLTNTNAKNPTGLGQVDTTLEGRTNLNVDGWNGSFAVGAMVEAVPDQFWIAGSYQAQPALGDQVLSGKLDVTTSLAGTLHDKVTFTQDLPDVYRAGLRYRPKKTPFEFRVFGDYTRWSVMLSQCITLVNTPCVVQTNGANLPPPAPAAVQNNLRANWNDSWGVRGGVSYWVKPDIETFIGGGYETAAIPDATLTPLAMDANNISGALGVRLKISDMMFMSLSWTHIQYLDRDTTGKGTLAAVNGQAVQTPTLQEDNGGIYKQWVGVFDGALEALF